MLTTSWKCLECAAERMTTTDAVEHLLNTTHNSFVPFTVKQLDELLHLKKKAELYQDGAGDEGVNDNWTEREHKAYARAMADVLSIIDNE